MQQTKQNNNTFQKETLVLDYFLTKYEESKKNYNLRNITISDYKKTLSDLFDKINKLNYSNIEISNIRTKIQNSLFSIQIDEYKQRIQDVIQNHTETKSLSIIFIKEVRKIINEARNNENLPKNVINYIMEKLYEAVNLMQEIKEYETKNSDLGEIEKEKEEKEVAKITSDAKKIFNIQTHNTEKLSVKYNEIPIHDLNLNEIIPNLYLPNIEAGYKGGASRIALKLYLEKHFPDFDKKLLDAELPVSDFDVVIKKTNNSEEIGKKMGADPDGIEIVDEFNIGEYMANRDVTINQVLLSKNKLYYTDDALNDMITGRVRTITSRTNSIFGNDVIFVDGKVLITPRGLQRLVKFVVEEKAKFFELPQYNLKVNMGIYWLVIRRKIKNKPNADELIKRRFNCAKQMNQTETTNPHDFLDELFNKYPFFTEEKLNTGGVAKRILSRYLTAITKHIRNTHNLNDSERDKDRNKTIVCITGN